MFKFIKRVIKNNRLLYSLATFILLKTKNKNLYNNPIEESDAKIFGKKFFFPKHSKFYKNFFFNFEKYIKSLELQYNELSNKFSLREIDFILDIGSNLGYQALFYNYFFKKKVICFEPSKINFFFLKKNLSHSSNFQIFNFVLGEKDEKKNLSIPNFDKHNNDNFGLFTLNKKEQTKIFSEEVLIKCFDNLNIISESNKNIYIKIDVEGFELNVLKGMAKFIHKNNCFFKVELNNNYYDHETIRRLINFFNEKNYSSHIFNKEKGIFKKVSTNDLINLIKVKTYEVFFKKKMN